MRTGTERHAPIEQDEDALDAWLRGEWPEGCDAVIQLRRVGPFLSVSPRRPTLRTRLASAIDWCAGQLFLLADAIRRRS